MCLWAVIDYDTRTVLTVLDDSTPTCVSAYGNPPCGGCDACLFAQADYSDHAVIPVPVDEGQHATFGDSLGDIMSGRIPPGRLHALQTCIERKWAPGQTITSSTWKQPRQLMGSIAFNAQIAKVVPHQAIRVAVLKPDGSRSREEYLYSFPGDVTAIVTPTEAEHATSSVA